MANDSQGWNSGMNPIFLMINDETVRKKNNIRRGDKRHMVKLLFMDVDGTLTDGSIVYTSTGEECKVFNIKDGYGICELLPTRGIVPVIITGRTSAMVEKRAAELGITELYQGFHDKEKMFLEIADKYHCKKEEIAYIGDDILDKKCMEMSGHSGCPSDAVTEIREFCDYVCSHPGGHGAVREFIEWLISER